MSAVEDGLDQLDHGLLALAGDDEVDVGFIQAFLWQHRRVHTAKDRADSGREGLRHAKYLRGFLALVPGHDGDAEHAHTASQQAGEFLPRVEAQVDVGDGEALLLESRTDEENAQRQVAIGAIARRVRVDQDAVDHG